MRFVLMILIAGAGGVVFHLLLVGLCHYPFAVSLVVSLFWGYAVSKAFS